MKFNIIGLLFASFLNTCGGICLISANPFTAKTYTEQLFPSRDKTEAKVLLYKGYALTGEAGTAFVEYKDNQYIVKEGDNIEKVKIVNINTEYIDYKLRRKIYRVHLLKDGKKNSQ